MLPPKSQLPGALEQIAPFKQRKLGEEKRLSDELRDYIRKIYDIKEDFIRCSQNVPFNTDFTGTAKSQ